MPPLHKPHADTLCVMGPRSQVPDAVLFLKFLLEAKEGHTEQQSTHRLSGPRHAPLLDTEQQSVRDPLGRCGVSACWGGAARAVPHPPRPPHSSTTATSSWPCPSPRWPTPPPSPSGRNNHPRQVVCHSCHTLPHTVSAFCRQISHTEKERRAGGAVLTARAGQLSVQLVGGRLCAVSAPSPQTTSFTLPLPCCPHRRPLALPHRRQEREEWVDRTYLDLKKAFDKGVKLLSWRVPTVETTAPKVLANEPLAQSMSFPQTPRRHLLFA
ncbi:hypothetical protein GWK47_034106 [Chionoecetes opilio]|uniref:Uncharacterized protein n=1 Tax=Chionoecetes opilio TaxID=41210 RepID=A0A8J5CP97_CHIOP|nr:hypothetical protein GWK47_034106 [Chionoecetes opilio]